MDNLRVLKFHGEIDSFEKHRIERELEQIEGFGGKAFTILDLTKVRYIDTTFLNALIRVRNRLAKPKPDVRICLVAPRNGIVRRIFEITKLDAFFPIFDDMPSARRSRRLAVLPHTLAASA